MSHDQPIVSDIALERFRLQELPAEEAARIAAHQATDADLRARLESLAHSDDEIRRQYPPAGLAALVVSRRPARARRGPGAWRWAVLAPAGLALAIFAWVETGRRGPREAPSTTPPAAISEDRVKGAVSALVLYRREGARGEPISDGDVARAGDLIRIAYRSAGPRYGLILSIDGAGVVTRHLPVDGPEAAVLQPGATVLLDRAYELDAAPRWEQFFLVTGETRFDVGPVLEAARRAAATAGADPPTRLSLASTFGQATFLLRKPSKEARP